jgi:phenylacetic acid degradation operon negative regulatory protein
MKPKAKNLVLDLLLARDGESLSARECIAACALFGISANNVRVALARLSAEGLIEASERGRYIMSDTAHQLADEVALWRSAEQRVRDWHGQYLAVHCGALGRSNRAALRQRERALRMLGFRELDAGLFLRPDNLGAGVEGVRVRLKKLGLQGEASVFVASNFDAERSERIRKLWDGKALNASYRKLTAQLNDWMARADQLDAEAAARESFLLGGRAIREIVYDPLLPAPFVDIEARRQFVDTVHRYDAFGKAIWRSSHDMTFNAKAASPLARKH